MSNIQDFRKSFIIAIAFSFLTVAIVHSIDFFGDDDRKAEILMNFQARYLNNYQPENLDSISLILVSEEDIEKLKITWPPTLGWYAKMLSDIACRKPKTIVVDITINKLFFTDNSENGKKELENFYENLEKISEGTQVCPNNVKAQATQIYIPLPDKINFPDKINLRNVKNIDLHSEQEGETRRYKQEYPYNPGNAPSPAYAVFKDLCLAYPDNKVYTCQPDKYFVVLWSELFANRNNILVQDDQCKEQAPEPQDFFLRTFKRVIKYQEFVPNYSLKCYPFAYRTAYQLIEPQSLNDQNVLNALIFNKYVFVGGRGISPNDFIETPVHLSKFPGVIFHAMALENMLTLNKTLKHLVPENLFKIILFVSLFVVTLLIYSIHFVQHKSSDGPIYWLIPMIFTLLISGILILFFKDNNWTGEICVIFPLLATGITLEGVGGHLKKILKELG